MARSQISIEALLRFVAILRFAVLLFGEGYYEEHSPGVSRLLVYWVSRRAVATNRWAVEQVTQIRSAGRIEHR